MQDFDGCLVIECFPFDHVNYPTLQFFMPAYYRIIVLQDRRFKMKFIKDFNTSSSVLITIPASRIFLHWALFNSIDHFVDMIYYVGTACIDEEQNINFIFVLLYIFIFIDIFYLWLLVRKTGIYTTIGHAWGEYWTKVLVYKYKYLKKYKYKYFEKYSSTSTSILKTSWVQVLLWL